MTNVKSIWILGLIILFGCSSSLSDVGDIVPIDSGLELKNIVKLIGPSPTDKPAKITEYEREKYLYDKFKYYSSDGKELLDVTVNSVSGDTSYFAVYEYVEGMLKRKKEYLATARTDIWQEFEYFYDNSKRLNQITLNGENFELYSYDEYGRVERITLGSNLAIADFYQFTYDTYQRVNTQELKSATVNDPPLRHWTYVYDTEDSLLAKQVISNNEPKDMFIYKYDSRKRLAEIEELYPEYDFTSLRKTRFTYPSLDNE